METRSMITFDWAMKRLLRQKANFDVLEGFLSELLRRKIIIKNLCESEGNKSDENDKWNKVDILVEADGKELVIIELQYDNEYDYFQRMLYGVSKSVTEYMHQGDPYSAVRKVYSVNIVYFELGKGDDYVYHGFTNFTGLHTHSELQLTAAQQRLYGKTVVGELLPEYYIIKVRNFNDIAESTLDEWIYYLKYNKISDDFTAQGLDKARQILSFDKLTDSEKRQYWRRIEERRIQNNEIETALLEGETKGEARGLAKGLAKGEAEREQLKAERAQLKAELEGKEEKEAELLARIAALEQQLSETSK